MTLNYYIFMNEDIGNILYYQTEKHNLEQKALGLFLCYFSAMFYILASCFISTN